MIDDKTSTYFTKLIDLVWPYEARYEDKLQAELILRRMDEAFSGIVNPHALGPVLFNAVSSPRDFCLVNVFQVYCAFWEGVDKAPSEDVCADRIVKMVSNIWMNTPEGMYHVQRLARAGVEDFGWPRADILAYAAAYKGLRIKRYEVEFAGDAPPRNYVLIGAMPAQVSQKLCVSTRDVLRIV